MPSPHISANAFPSSLVLLLLFAPFPPTSSQFISSSSSALLALYCRDNSPQCPLYYSYCFISLYKWCMSTHCRRTCGYCARQSLFPSVPYVQQQPGVMQPIIQPIIQPVLPLTPIGNTFGGTFPTINTFPSANTFPGGTTFTNFPGRPNIPTVFSNNFPFGNGGGFGR
uniref:ShKT domain-containing protein n=1 Tax=Globodera rostochiensis TaxID=31243 RepID=A0A914HCY7_GLORO